MHNLHPREKPQEKLYWWIKKTQYRASKQEITSNKNNLSHFLISLSNSLSEPRYFSLSDQFYTTDAETQIAQNLDTCVTAFNSLDSLLHELAHVLHLCFSKTTVAELFSLWT